MHNSREGTEHW